MKRPFLLYHEILKRKYRLEIKDFPKGIKTYDQVFEEIFDEKVLGSTKMEYAETHFGVHDVSFGDRKTFGFTSYEWEVDKMEELKEFWSEWLSQLGFVVGNWK